MHFIVCGKYYYRQQSPAGWFSTIKQATQYITKAAAEADVGNAKSMTKQKDVRVREMTDEDRRILK